MSTWTLSNDVRPTEPGWYPTRTKWHNAESYIPAAHLWLGDRWKSAVPERISSYYSTAFECPTVARQMAYSNEFQTPGL